MFSKRSYSVVRQVFNHKHDVVFLDKFKMSVDNSKHQVDPENGLEDYQQFIQELLIRYPDDKCDKNFKLADLRDIANLMDFSEVYNKKLDVESNVYKLCAAIIRKDNESAKLCLKTIDKIETTKIGLLPFHLAVEKDCDELVRLMIEKGANVNLRSRSETTPLLRSVLNENIPLTKLFIQLQVDVNVPGPLGYTPLCVAVQRGNMEIIKMLVERGAWINYHETYSPEYAFPPVFRCDIETVQKKRFPPLLLSRNHFNLHNISEMAPIHFAAYWDRLNVVEYLLNNGADINAVCTVLPDKKWTALHWAVDKESIEMVKLLVSKGVNIEGHKGQLLSPIHVAIIRNHKDTIQYLIDHGVDLNLPCRHFRLTGYTPLHLAAVNQSADTIKLLLERNVAVDALTVKKETAIHLAAKKDTGDILTLLLTAGADINSTDDKGRNALHIACETGNANIIQTLLEYGCDIEAKNNKFKTPMRCIGDTVDEWKDYIHERDFNVPTFEYEKILDWSIKRLHDRIVVIVKKYIIMMRCTRFPGTVDYSPDYSTEFDSDIEEQFAEEFKEFEKKCSTEIESMKKCKIRNSSFSFYNILSKNVDRMVIILRNQRLKNTLESTNYKNKYPIYANMFQGLMLKALKRIELLDLCKRIFYAKFNCESRLPQDCVEHILWYLSNKDLHMYIIKHFPKINGVDI